MRRLSSGTRKLIFHYTSFTVLRAGWQCPTKLLQCYHRSFRTVRPLQDENSSTDPSKPSFQSSNAASTTESHPKVPNEAQKSPASPPDSPAIDWDEDPDLSISKFSQLPFSNFGYNQHMVINDEFKEALRQILWQFRAPIRYAFAYGSGVFPQAGSSTTSASSVHPKPNPAITKVQGGNGKMIDFIFGVSYSQHWHSLNLQQHRNHYSLVGSFGSYMVSQIQDKWGAGVYFNPFVTVNGTLIKYGVVNLDTLCRDLSEWDTLYLAGRLQKPVKILRDDARVRLANQVNLISALRTALLLLPPDFTEQELYSTITGISYLGDPRMSFGTENPNKIANIVKYQLPHFRRLYAPLIEDLPNVAFKDPRRSQSQWADDPDMNAPLAQDMDPQKRGNMVRRLPESFRKKLYFRYQSKFQIPRPEFDKMLEDSNDEDSSRVKRRQGGAFERRVASDDLESLKREVNKTITKTIAWSSTMQSIKGLVMGGFGRSWTYLREKNLKSRAERGAKKDEGERDSRDAKPKGHQDSGEK